MSDIRLFCYYVAMYLLGITHKLGSDISTNTEVESKYGLEKGFILEKTGIKERRKFSNNEDPVELCVKAAQDLLVEHKLSLEDIKVVYGSSNPYSSLKIPSETHQVAIKLGMKDVGVHHTNYGCGGYLAAFQDMLNYFKTTEKETYILFILSDHPSKMVKDYNTEALFSDAVCVSLWTNSEKFSTAPKVEQVFYSNLLENPDSIILKDGYLGMDGGDVSRFVLKLPEKISKELNINFSDYTIIPHQANPKLLETLEKQYGIQVYKQDAINFGNTTCSAMFIALENNLKNNSDKKDFLCMAFGDTESYGAFIVK